MNDFDVAIAHKDYDCIGGGEMVAEELSGLFDAPLFCGYATDEVLEDRDADIRSLFDAGLTGRLVKRGGIFRHLLYQFLWERVPQLAEFDVIIQSGTPPMWHVPKPGQAVVTYVHSTPRPRYDLQYQQAERATDTLRQKMSVALSHVMDSESRQRFQPNLNYPDLFVCNSETVARRVRRYWNIDDEDIRIVYPPVDTHAFDPSDGAPRDYLFSLSRLGPHKGHGEMIEACVETGDELKIAGTGPEEDRLRELAAGHDNIELLGFVDEEEKRRRLAECRAFLFNAIEEDFGIAPVEAFAAGTPVIGVNEGFTEHQIIDGFNGVSFDRGELADAITQFNGVAWSPTDIADFAEHFSIQEFRRGMVAAVDEARQRATVTVDWEMPATEQPTKAIADGGKNE